MSSGYCERCTDCAGAIVSTCGFDKCAYRWLYTFIRHLCLEVWRAVVLRLRSVQPNITFQYMYGRVIGS
jgi:hypothetical protein